MFGMLSVLAELQRAPPAALIGDLQRRQQHFGGREGHRARHTFEIAMAAFWRISAPPYLGPVDKAGYPLRMEDRGHGPAAAAPVRPRSHWLLHGCDLAVCGARSQPGLTMAG
jgi:hypothetical protein